MEEYWNVNINSSNKNVEPINDLYNRVENFFLYTKKYPDKDILIVGLSAIVRAIHYIVHNEKRKSYRINYK